MRKPMNLFAAGTLAIVTLATVTLAGCSSAVLSEIEDDAKKSVVVPVVPVAKGGEFSSIYAAGSWIAAHEELTFTSLEDMETTGATVTDGTNEGTVAFAGTGNRVLTLKPPATALWNASGDEITISFEAKTVAGPILKRSIAVHAFRGCFVRTDGSDSAGSGTLASPLKTINKGIDKAKALYVDTALGAAEVRVAQGTYQLACSRTVHLVDMVSGVSVKGGYKSDFTQRSTFSIDPAVTIDFETVLENTATTADDSKEFEPSSVIKLDNIATNTEVSGFKIQNGGSSSAYSGIYCKGGSPSIKDIRVEYTGTKESEYSYGVFLDTTNVEITRIQSIAGNASQYSCGIRIKDGNPVITNSSFKGGICSAGYLNAVYQEAGTGSFIDCSFYATGKITQEIVYINIQAHPVLHGNSFKLGLTITNNPYFFYEDDSSSDPTDFSKNIFYVKTGTTCTLYQDNGFSGKSITPSTFNDISVSAKKNDIERPLSDIAWGNTCIEPL